MRHLVKIAMGVLLAAMCVGLGCDDRSTSAPAPPAVEAVPKGPTTAEILATPRKMLALGAFPLVLENAPQTWELKASDGTASASFSIEGPAPHGPVHIILSKPPMHYGNADSIVAMAQSAKKEMAEHPRQYLSVDFRALPLHDGITLNANEGLPQILDKRTLRVIPATQASPSTAPTTFPNEVEWTLLVFVPKGRQFEVCALEFESLSEDQYNQDRGYLEGIINTLTYDPSSAE